MKVGVVSNNINSQKQNIGMASTRHYNQSSNIADSFSFSGGLTSSVSKADATLLKIFSGCSRNTLKEVFLPANKKFFSQVHEALQSQKVGAEVKKMIITDLFAKRGKLKAIDLNNLDFEREILFDGYIHGGLVPHIIKTKDKDLAAHVLQLTEINADSSAGELIERTQFVAALGNSKQHLAELQSYMGDGKGIPKAITQSEEYLDKHIDSAINNWAYYAIVKLNKSPSFKVNPDSRIELYRKSLGQFHQD